MKSNYKILAGIFLFLILIFVFLPHLFQDQDTLTDAERKYLTDKKVIKIGVDRSFAPYEFVDNNANVAGITIDLLHIMSINLGINFQFIPGTWEESLQRFRNGTVDMLNNVTPTESRKKYMAFTDATFQHTASIYVLNHVQNISKLEDLHHRLIGMKQGTSLLEKLQEKAEPELEFITLPEPKHLVNSLVKGQIDAVIGYDFPFQYAIFNTGATNIKKVGQPISSEIGTFAVHKHNKELLSILSKGLSSISSKERNKLQEKWLGIHYNPSLREVIENHLIYILTAFILIIGVFVWNRFLYHKLEKQNIQIIENEKKYRTLFNYNNDMIILIKGHKIAECNKIVFDTLGWEQEQIIGQPFLSLFGQDPKEQQKIESALHQTTHDNNPKLETVIFDKNKKQLYVKIELTQIQLQKKDYIFALIRDISDFKLLIKEIQVKQEQFFAFMDHFPGAIFIKDKNLKTTYINRYMKSILNNDRWFEKKPEEIFPPNVARKRIETDKQALKEGYVELQEEISDQQGITKIYKTRKFRIDLPTGEILLGGISLDITETKEIEDKLKNSELQLRSIFAAMEDFVCEVDYDGRYLFVAPTSEELMFGPKMDMVNKTLHEVFPTQKADKFLAFVRKTIDTGKMQTIQYPLRIDDKDYWFEGRAHTKTDNSVIFIAQDITERKESAEKLEEYRKELEHKVEERTKQLKRSQFALQNLMEDTIDYQDKIVTINEQLSDSNKELEAFAYSVSHDLRAPLRHIDGFANLLTARSKTKLDEKCLTYLDNIHESIIYMSKLIDDLLIYSRTTRKELNKEKINMGKIVKKAIKLYEQPIAENNIEIKLDKLPEVFVDTTMMMQVWTNLLSNAIKFTKNRKKPQITIGSKQQEKATVFFIEDNGVGFDQEYAEKLFGVFQRLHSNKNYPGTGIGLANVKKIIEKHGGKIRAEGKPDQGAAFYFTIEV